MNRIIDCGVKQDDIIRGERSWKGWVKFDNGEIIESPLTEKEVGYLWADAVMTRVNYNLGK